MSHHRGSRERSEREEGPGRMIRARTALEVGEAAAYLETLAQALRAGGVTVRKGSELAALRVGERAELRLEAGEEGAQSVLRLELRWETPQPEERLEITPGVASASGEPGPQGSPGGPASQSAQASPGNQGGQGRAQGGQGRAGRPGGPPSGDQAPGAEGS